jgi:peptide/nickel transport system permease protein
MGTFIVRRALWTVLVLFAISAITFLIFFKTPGVDPARQMAGRNPQPAVIAQITREFDFNKPLPYQYVVFMDHLLVSRDLVSYTNRGVKVIPEIESAAPVTLSLVFGAAVIWIVFSIAIGLAAAVSRGKPLDPILMILGLIGISMPVFWLGEVVQLITQDRLHNTFVFHWMPSPGYVPITSSPLSWASHLILPWITLSILYIGFYGRVLRSSLLEVQNEDYIRTARAKGLSSRRVLFRHVLRTSMITFVSLFGLDFGALVGGGALLTEVVFALPGVGYLTYLSISNLDLPVIMGTVVYGAFFIVLANVLVDVVYAWLDPRIRPT